MTDLFRKTMYTGVGLALLTKEKIENLGRELVERGALPEKEGQDFITETLKKSQEARAALKKQINSVVKEILKKMDLVSSDELKKLKQRIARLEKNVKGTKK